ncbi:MAG: tetratricopeptide repeat protein [Dehalococcoidia bacterium]|nr:MAG: tetratricopeptide repeat protein [Dehalococcoidia bacterium]
MNTFEETLARFRDAVSGPAEDVSLARAALVIAQSEYPYIDLDAYERRLQDMADTLAHQLGRDPAGQTPHLVVRGVNRYLYRELGFRGNSESYDDPRNLYLSEVLSERLGIPVTLAIVYAEVCQRVGLDVRPVGLPGHLICRYTPAGVTDEADSLLIDVFNYGRLLTPRDCQVLLRNIFGARVPYKEHYLASLSPRQVIQRLLHNLKAGYLQHGDEDRAARVIDLLITMFPWDLDEIRDRGMLRERLGEVDSALSDLEEYVRFRAGARDIHTVTEAVRSLRRHRSDGPR